MIVIVSLSLFIMWDERIRRYAYIWYACIERLLYLGVFFKTKITTYIRARCGPMAPARLPGPEAREDSNSAPARRQLIAAPPALLCTVKHNPRIRKGLRYLKKACLAGQTT